MCRPFTIRYSPEKAPAALVKAIRSRSRSHGGGPDSGSWLRPIKCAKVRHFQFRTVTVGSDPDYPVAQVGSPVQTVCTLE